MRQTIELLRKQSIQAGLTTAHMQSMGVQVNGQVNGNGVSALQSAIHNEPIMIDFLCSIFSTSSQNTDQTTAPPMPSGGEMQRHHSSDSMCSLNSVSSGCSAQDKNKKKKGWVRFSFESKYVTISNDRLPFSYGVPSPKHSLATRRYRKPTVT